MYNQIRHKKQIEKVIANIVCCDMDLEKFFDTLCQSKLIEILSKTIKDGRVISLIYKYLNASVVNKRFNLKDRNWSTTG